MFSLFPKHEYSPVLNKQSLQHWLDPFFRQFFFCFVKSSLIFFFSLFFLVGSGCVFGRVIEQGTAVCDEAAECPFVNIHPPSLGARGSRLGSSAFLFVFCYKTKL